MSKGNRGNKEAKKPKQVRPAVAAPAAGTSVAPAPSGFKPLPLKK